MQDKPFVVVIVGPTASGKTALAVSVAERFNGEVVSADSMQIYKAMNIATAKPDADEMCGITHHMIDFLPPDKNYSVADYVSDAKHCISDIISRNKLPVIAGGTGLYVDSLINNVKFIDTPNNYTKRNELSRLSDENGSEYLLNLLNDIDPETANVLHPNNTKKIIRALEVYYTTGKKMSDVVRSSKADGTLYIPLFIGINYHDRDKLYSRINSRVDMMMQNGLLEEAKQFYSCYGMTSSQAIGYKELLPFLNGEKPLDSCIESLKKSTRNYAKRQLTWFRRNERINWFYRDDYNDINTLYGDVYKLIERKR